jgi:hexosaminidase
VSALDQIFAGEPAFPVRGFMLDISRNKVPTMASLFALVDQLAAWRMNHLQLYTEHTFAYAGHEEVWRDASPLTAAEIRALDAYCRERDIELCPNQNSFGHLQRWLQLPAYAHLAEAPGGYVTPWGETRHKPFSLNPLHPGSIALVTELYDQLLPNFTSRRFNVGCDETFDLGQGASREACEKLGKGRVYLDFLKKIRALVHERGHSMLFWGDIILNHPELIPELDRDDIALVWGYEAAHPFDEQCARFAKSSVPFWVCPGTSAWNSITGRFRNARENLQAAARAGLRHGASGFLVTEWGDNGHWQTTPFSRLALATAAVTAWTGHTPDDETLRTMVDQAGTLIELGNLYLEAGFELENNSPIFPLIRFSDPAKTLDRWSEENLRRVLERAEAIASAQIDESIALGATMLAHAARRGLWLKSGRPAAGKPALAAEIDHIIAALTTNWLRENRPGGLPESLEPLHLRRAEYAPETGT